MYARYEHTYVPAYICVRRLFVCIYVYSRVYICKRMCVCAYAGEGGCRLHEYIREYIRPIHRHRDVYTGWGSVRGRRQWAFDTTRSIERLVFSVSQRYLSGRDKRALYRMPEKYFYIDSLPYVYVFICMYLHVLHMREVCCRKHC